MCNHKSGVGVKAGDDVKVYSLPGEDSHTEIYEHYHIRSGLEAAVSRATSLELRPVRGMLRVEDYDLCFDDVEPDWWTEQMTVSATKQLFEAAMAQWDGMTWRHGGDAGLGFLQSIPAGVTLQIGGHAYLDSLQSIPEGVTLKIGGGYARLGSLQSISEGVTLEIGGSIYCKGTWLSSVAWLRKALEVA